MPDVNPSRIPDNNLSNSSFIKNPGNKVKNPERFVDQEQEKKEREQAKFAAKNMALSQALADGEISGLELAKLAKFDFTVDDVQRIFNNSIGCESFSDEKKQKLIEKIGPKYTPAKTLRIRNFGPALIQGEWGRPEADAFGMG